MGTVADIFFGFEVCCWQSKRHSFLGLVFVVGCTPGTLTLYSATTAASAPYPRAILVEPNLCGCFLGKTYNSTLRDAMPPVCLGPSPPAPMRELWRDRYRVVLCPPLPPSVSHILHAQLTQLQLLSLALQGAWHGVGHSLSVNPRRTASARHDGEHLHLSFGLAASHAGLLAAPRARDGVSTGPPLRGKHA